MLLDGPRSCLLVIDVQERLAPAIHDGDSVTARIALLLRVAAQLEVPILASEQAPERLGPTREAIAALLPSGARFAKTLFSWPRDPRFASCRQVLNGRRPILMGMETHVCVLQSALALIDLGYAPVAVADACGSRRASDHAAGLARMKAKGVEIATSEMVVFEWLGSSDHAAFRDVIGLIK